MKPNHPPGKAACWVILLGLTTWAGCSDELHRSAVSGKVRVDGKPLATGAILFYPVEGNHGPSSGAAIENGVYQIPRKQGVVPGKNRVEIRGFRTSGRLMRDPLSRDPTQLVEMRVPALGPEYNDRSTLVRDIKEGTDTQNFDLPGTMTPR